LDTITLYHQGVPVVRQAISGAVFTIGSDPGSDLVLAAEGIAERHLEIFRGQDGRWRARGAGAGRGGGAAVEPGTPLRVGPFAVELCPASGEDRAGGDDPVGDRFAGPAAGLEARIVGRSTEMRLVRMEIARLAPLRAPVLITGETGTGKELAARELHGCSRRAGGPFVALNCGSLTETLVEDVLFGHERGAFTGAGAARRGVFERAHGGTVFLDEIGELPSPQQAALLRVLDDGRVTRVGGEGETALDFRLVAATNRDLSAEVEANRFRLDLFHRLAALRIQMPPLRDRPADVELLAERLLESMADDVGARELSDSALTVLRAHAWPGNARELRNVLYRAAALGSSRVIAAADLDLDPGDDRPRRSRYRLEHVPDGRIEEIVAEHGDNISAAARALGLARSTVRDRLRRIRAGCGAEPHGTP
jgi:DNA-binding NtrC family response regulator